MSALKPVDLTVPGIEKERAILLIYVLYLKYFPEKSEHINKLIGSKALSVSSSSLTKFNVLFFILIDSN